MFSQNQVGFSQDDRNEKILKGGGQQRKETPEICFSELFTQHVEVVEPVNPFTYKLPIRTPRFFYIFFLFT